MSRASSSIEADAWGRKGWEHAAAREYDTAVHCFLVGLALRRASPWWSLDGIATPAQDDGAIVNILKLDHDIEQISYLLDHQALPDAFAEIEADYRRLRQDFLATYDRRQTIHLRRGLYPAFDTAYLRMLRWRGTPPRPGNALADGWDRREVEARYARPPGICWIDGLLSEQTLADLRAFALESTIWNDIAHNFADATVARGYLGTYAGDGFCAPLLFQIAEELTRALPGIFGDHRLQQMWAYKYEPTLEGIAMHGDDAAINVNFWITPDSSNLDPSSGGLIVHPVEAPAEWSFDDMNMDQGRISRFLAESPAEPVVVPYRQNRAVIFNSDLFHATAPLRFKPGYENRRINVTMLFGHRGT